MPRARSTTSVLLSSGATRLPGGVSLIVPGRSAAAASGPALDYSAWQAATSVLVMHGRRLGEAFPRRRRLFARGEWC